MLTELRAIVLPPDNLIRYDTCNAATLHARSATYTSLTFRATPTHKRILYVQKQKNGYTATGSSPTLNGTNFLNQTVHVSLREHFPSIPQSHRFLARSWITISFKWIYVSEEQIKERIKGQLQHPLQHHVRRIWSTRSWRSGPDGDDAGTSRDDVLKIGSRIRVKTLSAGVTLC